MVFPNQLSEENNKGLGLGYDPESDKLHLMVAVNFSKKKMKLGENLSRGSQSAGAKFSHQTRAPQSSLWAVRSPWSRDTCQAEGSHPGEESFSRSKGQVQSIRGYMGHTFV